MKQPIIPQLAEREYLNWDANQQAKFELHHGFIMAFAGATVDQDTIAFNLRSALSGLYARPCRTFGADVKVRVSPDTFYYADAGVTCEALAGEATIVGQPHIVAEVLSRSTRSYDLIEKRAAYRGMSGLAAYVVVHTDMRRCEVDVRGLDGAWRTETYDDGDAFVDGRMLAIDRLYSGSSLEEDDSGSRS